MGPLSYATPTINSKWINDLNIRPEAIKLLKENIEDKFLDISLSIEFLDLNPKAKAAKVELTTAN